MVAGVVTGLAGFITLGESGPETVGFSTGLVVLGVEGLAVGTVVSGVVMSICLVEIEIELCNFFAPNALSDNTEQN